MQFLHETCSIIMFSLVTHAYWLYSCVCIHLGI